MNRDTLVQADVAGLAAGVALAYLVRVLFGALDLSPNDAASFIGLSLVLGGPVILAFYALTGLYAENWRERGPWPAVAAIGWAGMIGAFLLAYNKPLTAPMGSLAMLVAGAAIGGGIAREYARRQPPKTASDGDGGATAKDEPPPAAAEPAPGS